MPDREKVIKGLEMCIKDIECTGCPYENDCFAPDDNPFATSMMRDALALLKEQEYKDKMYHALEEDWKALLKEQEAVVRCNNCKNLGYTNSHWFCKWLNRCVDEDWFCADGERRTDDA